MMRAALLGGHTLRHQDPSLGGDLIATDQDALNTWLTTWAEEGGSVYESDLGQLDHLSAVYKQWFDDQYAIMGNHDMRIDKKTGGQVTMQMLLRHTPIQFSRYSLHVPVDAHQAGMGVPLPPVQLLQDLSQARAGYLGCGDRSRWLR